MTLDNNTKLRCQSNATVTQDKGRTTRRYAYKGVVRCDYPIRRTVTKSWGTLFGGTSAATRNKLKDGTQNATQRYKRNRYKNCFRRDCGGEKKTNIPTTSSRRSLCFFPQNPPAKRGRTGQRETRQLQDLVPHTQLSEHRQNQKVLFVFRRC